MRKTESLFICLGLVAAFAATSGVLWHRINTKSSAAQYTFPTTKYGAFLAAQHAVYVNDFQRASEFAANVPDDGYFVVQNTKMLSDFLSGKMPDGAKLLQNEKGMAAGLVYDAYLVANDDWAALYKRHKSDESALASPLRIWASVATKRSADALKFVDGLKTNASWKEFVRGQIYAETGDIEKAAAAFGRVTSDFMNINDYLYVMSFYRGHDMAAAADALREDFTRRPGGMYMLDFDDIPQWDCYGGIKNQLAFSLVQNVSHTQIMMYSDLAILLLRFAQIVGPGYGGDNDTINYYLGQYFYNNTGDYAAHFNAISKSSPFYPFAVLRMAEKSGDMRALDAAVRSNPLFVPAANALVAHYISRGDQRAALRVVDRAIGDRNITDEGRAFFLKSRAQINFVFGDIEKAQEDIRAASDVLAIDSEILSLQAKIWAAQNRELDNAYDYAMGMIKRNPTDILAWDTLGYVVWAREGVDAALEVLDRVGEVANTCSSLFEHLGDLYVAKGENKMAADAYMRAIDLSGDGLTVIPTLEKKLRKIK